MELSSFIFEKFVLQPLPLLLPFQSQIFSEHATCDNQKGEEYKARPDQEKSKRRVEINESLVACLQNGFLGEFNLNEWVHLASEEETLAFGTSFATKLSAGDMVLLTGELGAGKTTLVRGILRGLGYLGAVRSPTFNLIQTFETDPPVMHADLYRLTSAEGIGLEDYFSSHLCLIEWPDRIGNAVRGDGGWQVRIKVEGERGRKIMIEPFPP